MLHFSPNNHHTISFHPTAYDIEDADDVFVCIVHASDTGDEEAGQKFPDLLDHLGEAEREQRLNLMETFGKDATAVLATIREIAAGTGAIDGGIHDAINVSDDKTLTDADRELVLSVDGAGPDEIFEAARIARSRPDCHPLVLRALEDLEDHQKATNEARMRLVALLMEHEPQWHRENREFMDALHQRLAERDQGIDNPELDERLRQMRDKRQAQDEAQAEAEMLAVIDRAEAEDSDEE